MDERRIAFLFPGQGAQFVGMGESLYRNGPSAVKDLYHEASEALGYDIAKISFTGPEDVLLQTRHTQPAIMVHSVAVAKLLAEEGIRPDFAAGHSLGEFSALVIAGALSFSDALRVVKVRAESMQAAGESNPGGMSAVIGLEAEKVRQACEKASATGIVQPANYNAPAQTVISGQMKAVEKAGKECSALGAKKVVELKVHGAFHSPLMESAVEPLRHILRQVEIGQADIPVVSNVTSRPAVRPEEIRELLVLQVVYPIRWVESMQELDGMGSSVYVECGPGQVLQGLLKRCVKGARAIGASDPDGIRNVIEELRS
ncbi:ACP S-malonyltransferase [Candidatus Zixiibacteriota bacterium]